MADINEILGRQINSVKELKAAIKELQDSLVGVDADSEQFKTTSEQLAAAQAELNKVTRAGKDDTDAAADSIRGMEQEYKKLYDTYKMLTEEQRNSDFGQSMAASLENLSTKLNDTKKDVGNFKDNIGRYAQSATEAFNGMGISIGGLQTPMKLAAGGAKTLGAALKSLIANPVGAIIMAIVVAFKALTAIAERVKKAINDNEESSNRLKEAMAVFKPVIDAVSNAFDFLGKIVVKVIEGISKVAEKIMSIIPGMKKAIDSHKELAKATNELTKAQREASVENSKKEAEIERLREEASAVDDVTEKRKLLEEAKAMQAEIDQTNIALAQEELRIMEEYAAKTANSAAENEKLAAAQKKVNDAIAQGERNMRMYNKQLDATETKTTGSGGVNSAIRKQKEEYEALVKAIEDADKTEKDRLKEDWTNNRRILLAKKDYKNLEKLDRQYYSELAEIEKKELDEELQRRKEEAQKIYDETKRAYDNYADNLRRWWENARQLTAAQPDGASEALIDKEMLEQAKQMVDEFYDSLQKEIAGGKDTLGKIWKTIFEVGDLSKITDYNYVEEILRNSALDDAEKDAVLKEFYNIGEEAWHMMAEGFEQNLTVLNNAFGLDIKNLPDVEARAAKLGQDIAVKTGEAYISELDMFYKDNTQKLYDFLFPMLAFDSSYKSVQQAARNIAIVDYELMEAEKASLEEELNAFSGTTDQKIQLWNRYYEIVTSLREKDHELAELQQQRTMEMVANLADMTDQMGGALSTYRTSQEQLIDSQVKTGQIDEKEAKKKKKRLLDLQRIERDFAVATILADAASGAFSIWKGYATEVGVINPQTAAAAGFGSGPVLAALNAKSLVSAIAKTGGLAATAAAQIAAAQNGYIAAKNNFMSESEGGGGGVSVGATPALIDSTPYSYTRTVQTQEDVDRLNQPIYVTVTDIEEGLGHRATVTNESSF